jgi:hypothetical protein
MVTDSFQIDKNYIDNCPWWNVDLDDTLFFGKTKKEHKNDVKWMIEEYHDLLVRMKYV